MPYKILASERKIFTLDDTDARYGVEGDPTRVELRTATIRQNQRREQLFADYIRETNKDGITRQVVHLAMYDMICRETFLTLVDSNIQGASGPLFKFKQAKDGSYLDMSYETFEEAWGLLPEDIALEIHKHVLEMNPHWRFTQETQDLGEE